MDFERIFPFIILYIVWRIFFRAQRKKPKAGKPDVSTDKADISVSPANVLKQMLFGGIEVPQTMEQERTAEMLHEEPPEYLPEDYHPEEQKPAFNEMEVPVSRKRRPSEDVIEAQPIRQTARYLKDSFTAPVYSRKDLQKAIVWSEILAPPLGLRDE